MAMPYFDVAGMPTQIAERIKAGEEVVLDDNGSPIANVVPLRIARDFSEAP